MKYYQYLGLAIIMVFSFYYTEQISLIVLNKNPLMITIKEEAANYEVKPVSAIIEGDYITPGINGLKVDSKESFYKMRESDVFNHYFLVYDEIKPDISLEDNKDKIIISGNSKLKKVSFILETENDISNYLKSKEIPASLLVTLDSYQKGNYFEVLNNEVDGFKSLENNLNLNKENVNICIVNESNLELCKKNKKYLVEPKLKLNSTNLIDIKQNIGSGSIIYITSSAKLSDVLYLIKEIKYKGLDIVSLSELISEKNN